MGINFPSSAAVGDIFNAAPGVSFVMGASGWKPAPLKTALPKNYIINPTMIVSQENIDAPNTAVAAGAWYAADTWLATWGLTGTVQCYRSRPAVGGTDAVLLQVVTTTPSPAAGAYLQMQHYIEGQRAAEFLWGTAQAKQAIFRFDFYAQLAGTYSVQIKNAASDRVFLAPVPIAANVWTTFSVVVPGDTTGTWLKDTGVGICVGWGLASGTTYGGGVAGWQGVNRVQLAGNTNAASAVSACFMANTGFYLDPYLTGVAPPMEYPNVADELRRCQRYWYRAYGSRGLAPSAVLANAMANNHPVPMRITPAAAIVGAPKAYDISSLPAMTSISANQSNKYALELNTGTTGMVAGRPVSQLWDSAANYFGMSARL